MTVNMPTVSKSTVTGVLSLLTTIGLALLASGSPLVGPRVTMWITLALAVLRALTGYFTVDATSITSADIQKANAVAQAKAVKP